MFLTIAGITTNFEVINHSKHRTNSTDQNGEHQYF